MNIWIIVLMLLTGASLITNGVMIANNPKKIDTKPILTGEVSSTIVSTPTGIIQVSPTPTTKTKGQQTQVKNVTVPTSIPTSVQTATQPTVVYIQPTTYTQPVKKSDYSSYQLALSTKLSSLQSRLNSVQSQANNVPNEVKTANANIDLAIASIKEQGAISVNRQIAVTAGELDKRGISSDREDYKQAIADAIAPLQAYTDSLVAELEYKKSQNIQDGINKLNQFASQEQDLTNKITTVQSLLNKLMSGSFTDSDIPLAIQVNSY